jgi:hypothetical protein
MATAMFVILMGRIVLRLGELQLNIDDLSLEFSPSQVLNLILSVLVVVNFAQSC